MAGVRQTNFSAGELSPLLWGRTDLPLYRAGLRTLRDFLVNRQGMAVSRPGTKFLGTLADSTTSAYLLPFIVSDSEGYLLELSFSGTMRAWKNGAVVWTGSVPFNVAGSRAPGPIQYAQSGDVLLVANRGRLYELTRTSATTFAWSVKSFTRKSPEWVNGTGAYTTPPQIDDATTLASATTTTPLRPWRWWASAVLRDSQGRVFESEAFEVTVVRKADGSTTTLSALGTAVGADRPITFQRHTSGIGLWAGPRVYEVTGYNYFRGVGDFAGFIGHQTVSEVRFVDDGREPDYSLPAPKTADPFTWTMPTGAVTDQPLTVAFFEDRLAFGGTLNRPNSALLSATGDYINFQRHPVVVPSQSLEFELAVRKRETIRAIAALQRLLLLTDAGVHSLGGSGALTPDSVSVRLVSEVGSAWLRPVMVGGDLLYVRNKGAGLRVVRQSDNAPELYTSGDVSWHARHLFEGIDTSGAPVQDPAPQAILDLAWQEDPSNLVWLVRADGKLISCQWDGGMAGYSLHATGPTWGDRFDAVAVVPEGDEDVVYVATNRSGKYCLERFASRIRRGTINDDACLDCHVAFSATPGSPTISLGAAGAVLEGRQVYVVARDNAPVGPLTVTAGFINLGAAGFRLPTANHGANVSGFIGLLYQPELELLDVVTADTRMKQRTVVKVGLEVSESKGLYVGQKRDAMVQWQRRSVSDDYGVPSAASEVVEVNVRGTWDNGGRVVVQQRLPLPVTILGVTREVDFGG